MGKTCKKCGKVLVGSDTKKKKCTSCRDESKEKVKKTGVIFSGILAAGAFVVRVVNKIPK
ncbi:hypothetical protein RI065_10095 [Mycoplasmatota bacterium zrk1]